MAKRNDNTTAVSWGDGDLTPPLQTRSGDESWRLHDPPTTEGQLEQGNVDESDQLTVNSGQPGKQAEAATLMDRMWLYLERQEKRLQQETELRYKAEERRHAELMALEQRRLNQMAASEAARTAQMQREQDERKKERELDRRLKEMPPLPRMETDGCVEMFLLTFENRMKTLEIPKKRWPDNLFPLLPTWGQRHFDILGSEDRQDYDKLSKALVKAAESVQGSLARRALQPKREPGQTVTHFLTYVMRLWEHWTDGKTPQQIARQGAMAVVESMLPTTCRNHVRDKAPETVEEMARIAEQYFIDHGISWDESRWKTSRQYYPGSPALNRGEGETRVKSKPPPQKDPRTTERSPDQKRNREYQLRMGECFNCGQRGHIAARCPEKTVTINLIGGAGPLTTKGKIGGKETNLLLDSGARMSVFPSSLIKEDEYTDKHYRAELAFDQTAIVRTAVTTVEIDGEERKMHVLVQPGNPTPLLGCDHPDLYKIIHREAEVLHTMQQQVNEVKQPDSLMNQGDKVEEDSSLAEEAEDVGVLGMEVAIVKTRNQRRSVEVQQQHDDEASVASGAIPKDLAIIDDSLLGTSRSRLKLTRKQKREQAQEISAQKKQKDTRLTLLTIDRGTLEKEQIDDPSLQPLWEAAEVEQNGYRVVRGLLRHQGEDEWGDLKDQLVVPVKFRQEAIALAHGSKWAAHLGAKKTSTKLLRDFFWPGLTKDVKDFCQGCENCQRGTGSSVPKAPLQPLPPIGEPFQRVAIDIVGPLPRTKRGNKYVLTIMDHATRYPEAVPLKRIDAATVAEELCTVFTRLGLPSEILSDQGSNFLSDLMTQVTEILGITRLKTSPYHPQTNGMLERFHLTLKSMVRKTADDKREWDTCLPYVCFAFRDAIHSSTGFTPFQLLFGRDVRGPLSLIYESLTGEARGGRAVADYVDTLKIRLRDAWQTAVEHDTAAKAKSKERFDKKAKIRTFEVGEQVLVLTPTFTDKLTDQWTGPYTVVAKLNDVTYKICTPERRKKTRLFHINSMKEWTSPTAVFSVHFCEEETLPATETLDVFPYERHEGSALPTIGDQLSPEQRRDLDELLHTHEALFDTNPGHTDIVEHRIETGTCKPVFHPPYRIPPAWKAEVREEIRGMLEAGIVVPSKSPWTSPLVPVRKKDGSLRLCVDYRQLNTITAEDRYPMPRVEELLEQLGSANYISTIDLTKGYYQVSVHPDDRSKTAFMAPMGKFEFKRMPFGLKGAPATFQRLMDTVLGECTGFAIAYLDDIIVFSATWMDHLKHLDEVFTRLNRAGLKAKPAKCLIAGRFCSYLGHRVGEGTISMEEAKIDALKNYARPVTKRDVRAFLGLAGYYRRFLPNFASLTARLSDLTKKDQPQRVKWTQELENDFQEMKKLLYTDIVLHCPDYTREFVLQTDASERGVGAILSQQAADGEEHPVAFFSRKLLPREVRYSTVEKECLAVVAAVKHFDVHLVGRHFRIITDHKALSYLQKMCNANARLTRWSLALQPFSFSITHRPGKQHGNADALSRQPWPEEDIHEMGSSTKTTMTETISNPRFAAGEGERGVEEALNRAASCRAGAPPSPLEPTEVTSQELNGGVD